MRTQRTLTSIEERLWFDHNELTGTIPQSWEAITALATLSIHHNSLTGPMPTYIGSAFLQLSDLSIQNNRFGGTIPSELGLCTRMRNVFMEENFFRSSPPSTLGNLHHLGKFGKSLMLLLLDEKNHSKICWRRCRETSLEWKSLYWIRP